MDGYAPAHTAADYAFDNSAQNLPSLGHELVATPNVNADLASVLVANVEQNDPHLLLRAVTQLRGELSWRSDCAIAALPSACEEP